MAQDMKVLIFPFGLANEGFDYWTQPLEWSFFGGKALTLLVKVLTWVSYVIWSTIG